MNTKRGDPARRARLIREGKKRRGPVIYWMSRDQRVDDNWALLYAQTRALQLQQPLRVVFCLTADFLGATLRHYHFLLTGLQEVHRRLAEENIEFHLLAGSADNVLPAFLRKKKAALLVADFDPLRIKRNWRSTVAEAIDIPFYEVDSHNIVPAWLASDKKEFAAHTFRPKIHRTLPDFLEEFPSIVHHSYGTGSTDYPDASELLRSVRDRAVAEVSWCMPGSREGMSVLRRFIENKLSDYPQMRNNPCLDGQSNLSPYLHFGQIAPQRVALEVDGADVPAGAKEEFLEELIVRRELADNFCYYEPEYDQFAGFHDWAKTTLADHRKDTREYLYDRASLERCETHDELWNSCQLDLAQSGKLNGYLRMYWAKKILEWSPSPEEAMANAIYLNDRYSLDGRDPNGYTGIAWSIGGIHDRAWAERPVFGKIRYMSYQGCRRKFNVDEYIRLVRNKES